MWSRAASACLALTLSVTLLAGCSNDEEPAPITSRVPVPVPSVTFAPTAEPEQELPVPPNLVKAFTRILDKRAAAVRDDDREQFLSVLTDEETLRLTQEAYFDNMRQLPLAEFDYGLRRRSLVRERNRYSVVVDLTTQLDGFDVIPVLSQFRFEFTGTGPQKKRFKLSSVVDPEWEEANGVVRQPWEGRPIQVRTGPGVLGIFDDDTVARSASVVESVSRGVSDVSGAVPLDWSRSAVVYALSDTFYLAHLGEVPGGDPELLDGLAVPIAAGPTGPASKEVADVRFVINPRMLGATRSELDRLVRHELAHIAIGERDDEVPLWLSEGLAEYISVRPLAPEDRRITPRAIKKAKAKSLKDLPEDDDFNGTAQELNYAVSWFACEYIASTYDPSALWALLEQLNGEDVDADARLKLILGLNTRTLARKSAKLIIATYRPQLLTPKPSSTPSDKPTAGAEVADPSGRIRESGNTVGR